MANALTLDYSNENLENLENLGYKKSPVTKPYSQGKVIRYSPKRMVYWFTSKHVAEKITSFLNRKKIYESWQNQT